jgi:Ca2+-binding RTX toxin-like protein
VLGDTTQDGARYSSRTDALNGAGRTFPTSGNDSIDASVADGSVILYGGSGADRLLGSAFSDQILGGSGDDVIVGGAGRDHIYGDNGLRVDLSVRVDRQLQLITIVVEQEAGATDFTAQTGDALDGAGSDNITASGAAVILADFGRINQQADTNRAFEPDRITSIVTLRETLGGDDTISTGSEADWIFAGAGADSVTGSGGNDVVLGDNGTLTVLDGAIRGTLLSSEPNPSVGGADTVSLGDGNVWVIGGQGGDAVTFGDGGGVLLGDNGWVEQTSLGALVRVETVDSTVGGVDTITGGNGAAVVLGGRDGDSVTLGTGDHSVAGDMASLDFVDGARTVFASINDDPSVGGVDTFSLGDGTVWVIGGQGGDAVTFGDGGGVLLGDNGRVEQTSLGALVRVETVDSTVGGVDTITGGNGAAVVLGGRDGDSVTLGTGNHSVAGDMASLDFVNGVRTVFASINDDPSVGGADTVTLDDGTVWVIGGQGGDAVMFGDGGGVLLGDNGRVEQTALGALVRVETVDSTVGGVDTITGGNGAAVVLGGRDGDRVTLGDGTHVVGGDMGVVTFAAGIRSTFEVLIETAAQGGDDSLTAGAGGSWAIMGEGGDSVTFAGGINVVLGDAGRITADAGGLFLTAIATQPDTGGSDTLIGGMQRDILIGGAGGDWLDGREDADLITGDGGSLFRTPELREIMFETFDITSGGNDTLIGGEGRDVMFGAMGDDKFDLSLVDDIVVGEFARVRLTVVESGDEQVTSFLVPAVRDLDLLAQLTLGLNGASNPTADTENVTETADEVKTTDVSSILAGTRVDLVLTEGEAARDAALAALMAAVSAQASAPGIAGFTVLSEPSLLAAPAEDQSVPSDGATEGSAPVQEGDAPANEDGPTPAEEEQQGRLEDGGVTRLVGILPPKEESVGTKGWRILNWRIRGDIAA